MAYNYVPTCLAQAGADNGEFTSRRTQEVQEQRQKDVLAHCRQNREFDYEEARKRIEAAFSPRRPVRPASPKLAPRRSEDPARYSPGPSTSSKTATTAKPQTPRRKFPANYEAQYRVMEAHFSPKRESKYAAQTARYDAWIDDRNAGDAAKQAQQAEQRIQDRANFCTAVDAEYNRKEAARKALKDQPDIERRRRATTIRVSEGPCYPFASPKAHDWVYKPTPTREEGEAARAALKRKPKITLKTSSAPASTVSIPAAIQAENTAQVQPRRATSQTLEPQQEARPLKRWINRIFKIKYKPKITLNRRQDSDPNSE